MTTNPRSESAMTLLMEGVLALSRAEQTGIRVDIEYIERKVVHLKRKIERADNVFKNSQFFKDWQTSTKGKVNVGSHAQLGKYLYEVKGYEPVKFTNTGRGSTDEESLLMLNIPELNALLEKSKIKKLIDVLEGFYKEQVNGVLHTNFNLHLVVSYRSSSDSPNFQNIPRRDEDSMQTCRKALYPIKGHQFIEVDLGSAEVRIAACYHKDETMLKYINDPTTDMHTDMAQQIFVVDDFDKNVPEHYLLRQAAKNSFVFPEFYGDYYKNCAEGLATQWGKLPQRKWKAGEGVKMPVGTLSDHLMNKGIKSYNSFVEHLKMIEKDFWGNRFPEYADWKEMWWGMYKKYGYVDLLTGFRCQGVMDKKQTINYPVQGAAFHCMLWALIQIDKLIIKNNWNSRIIGQVHDSILFSMDPDEKDMLCEVIRKVFTIDLPNEWKWLIVPIEIDFEGGEVDEPWSEKKKLKI